MHVDKHKHLHTDTQKHTHTHKALYNYFYLKRFCCNYTIVQNCNSWRPRGDITNMLFFCFRLSYCPLSCIIQSEPYSHAPKSTIQIATTERALFAQLVIVFQSGLLQMFFCIKPLLLFSSVFFRPLLYFFSIPSPLLLKAWKKDWHQQQKRKLSPLFCYFQVIATSKLCWVEFEMPLDCSAYFLLQLALARKQRGLVWCSLLILPTHTHTPQWALLVQYWCDQPVLII